MSQLGHNGHLNSFIQRIERLNEEKSTISADILEIFKEAKSAGFDPKIMRKVIAERKLDAADRAERDALIEAYMDRLGDFASAPLGQAAISKVG